MARCPRWPAKPQMYTAWMPVLLPAFRLGRPASRTSSRPLIRTLRSPLELPTSLGGGARSSRVLGTTALAVHTLSDRALTLTS